MLGSQRLRAAGRWNQFLRLTPVDVVGLFAGATGVAAGFHHSCALTSGGGVKCWGSNWAGQLGDGTYSDRLDAGRCRRSFRRRDRRRGGIRSLLRDRHGRRRQVLGKQRFRPTGRRDQGLPVHSGRRRRTLLRSDACHGGRRPLLRQLPLAQSSSAGGTILAGQLGDGGATASLVAVNVTGLPGGVTTIATGKSHSCALTTAGGVKCWGQNNAGQLGDGTTSTRLVPVEVSGLSSGVVAIDAGYGAHLRSHGRRRREMLGRIGKREARHGIRRAPCHADPGSRPFRRGHRHCGGRQSFLCTGLGGRGEMLGLRWP